MARQNTSRRLFTISVVLILGATTQIASSIILRARTPFKTPPPRARRITSEDALPRFSWRSSNLTREDIQTPLVLVIEHKSLTHHATLERYSPIEEMDRTDRHPCLFLGRIKGVAGRSSVAVSGCPGDEIADDGKGTQITVVSGLHTGQYLWKRGRVRMIPSPFQHAATWSAAVPANRTGESSFYDGGNAPKLSGHDDYTCIEQDEMMDLKREAELQQIEAYCQGGSCVDMPRKHRLTVRLGYDGTLFQHLGRSKNAVENWIEEVMVHAQALLLHPSLPTELHLKVIGKPKGYTNRYWKADSSINSLRPLAFGDKESNLQVYFCYDSKYFGTVGIAYVGGLCDRNYKVSLNEWRKTEAASGKVVAHEMGHNMGMSHDFSPKHSGRGCNGIMDYGDSEDAWSTCSRDDFNAQYALEMRTRGQHCMETLHGDDDDDDDEDSSSGNGFGGPPHSSQGSEESSESASGEESSEEMEAKCGKLDYVGDGYCDDENNLSSCDFDGGDCCMNSAQSWNYFCDKCECLDQSSQSWECASLKHQGDGYCDDANNVASCGYDLGDCCQATAVDNETGAQGKNKDWNFFCVECKCKA